MKCEGSGEGVGEAAGEVDAGKVVEIVEAWRLLVSGKTYVASLTNVRG